MLMPGGENRPGPDRTTRKRQQRYPLQTELLSRQTKSFVDRQTQAKAGPGGRSSLSQSDNPVLREPGWWSDQRIYLTVPQKNLIGPVPGNRAHGGHVFIADSAGKQLDESAFAALRRAGAASGYSGIVWFALVPWRVPAKGDRPKSRR